MADVGDEASRPPGPVVWKRWLGSELMRLRGAAKLKQSDVAKALKCSVARISYIESGDRLPSARELKDVLLPLYRVSEPDWQAYLDAAEGAEEHAWWDDWDDEDLPKQGRRFVGLEAGARQVRTYQPVLVPGLLQTQDYTKAVLESSVTMSQFRIARAIELRQTRQGVLSRKHDPLVARFVIDESVLRRLVGDTTTLRYQLTHLADVAERRSNIELRVMPFSGGAPGSIIGEFTIIEFDGRGDPLVFVESYAEWVFIEPQRFVRRYLEAFDRLTALSLGPDESIAMIRSLAVGEPE